MEEFPKNSAMPPRVFGPDPEFQRPTYDISGYAAIRQAIALPLEPREEFEAWLGQNSPKALTERLTVVEWIDLWNAFCVEQDVAHDAVDQSERSDGLEDTTQAALGGHFEPVGR